LRHLILLLRLDLHCRAEFFENWGCICFDYRLDAQWIKHADDRGPQQACCDAQAKGGRFDDVRFDDRRR